MGWSIYHFNPRLREGGDMSPTISRVRDTNISIHASAKEATIYGVFITISISYFNPRLREGGDNAIHLLSTLAFNFNPRLREGGDSLKKYSYTIFNISIHASAKEATTDIANFVGIF